MVEKSIMPPGWALYSFHRTSQTIYTSRPPANREAARKAWDRFAQDGEITQVRLLDGYWGCIRPNGDLDEVEAVSFRRKRR